ncbi:hypothetical protein C1I98_20390 [Spongiactinospora gelatinilytica]|uniref:Holin n=1 Tax=Spongiactinospora gelatinilytica TaxID=2666298 RepID=A0A2W2GHI8_9ACTN|nr:hypothetical protein [Spongiactinospora gelatinilytica]PZG42029.1 hypothetical protein C1I98_20390 [Spongiactinospora gelatinilytica]
MSIGRYAKAVVAALLAAITIINGAVSDSLFTTTEIVSAVLAVLAALGVYVVPNDTRPVPPRGDSAK